MQAPAHSPGDILQYYYLIELQNSKCTLNDPRAVPERNSTSKPAKILTYLVYHFRAQTYENGFCFHCHCTATVGADGAALMGCLWI